MSGFCRTSPPVEVKLPGVIGVPSGLKKTRRGPSEVKRSGCWRAVNASGNGPAGLAGSPGSRSNGSGSAAGRRGDAERVHGRGVAAGHARGVVRRQPVGRSANRPRERGQREVPVLAAELHHRQPQPVPPGRSKPLVRVLVAVLDVLARRPRRCPPRRAGTGRSRWRTRRAGRPSTASRARRRDSSDSGLKTCTPGPGSKSCAVPANLPTRGRSRRSRPPSCPRCRRSTLPSLPAEQK